MKCNMALIQHSLIVIAVVIISSTTITVCESETENVTTDQTAQQPDHSQMGRALFSPRVDYNEWTPVGRGDPLKNDPTYDYSPPVLDRVRYWAADANNPGSSNEQLVQKTDILLLGVTSKKPSSKKEPIKYHQIRRNFYSSLPTHLMPPPMMHSPVSSSSSSSGGMGQYHPSSQMMVMNTGWPATGPHSHKGSVTDVKDLSGSYVSIGRPNANLIQPEQPFNYENVNQFGQFGRPGNENHLKDGKKPFIHFLLQKEVTPQKPKPFALSSGDATPASPTMTMIPQSNYYSTDSYVIMPSIELSTMTSAAYYQPTTTTTPPPTYFLPTLPPTTVAPPTIATPLQLFDAKLSNYRESTNHNSNTPAMYHRVMIDGHSNVKTYGLRNPNETANVRHEPKIVTIGSTEDPVIRHVVSKDDRGHNMEVKHLHMKQPNPNMEQAVKKLKENESSAMQSLISLLDSSFDSYIEAERRNDDEKNSIAFDINSSSNSYGGEVRPRRTRQHK